MTSNLKRWAKRKMVFQRELVSYVRKGAETAESPAGFAVSGRDVALSSKMMLPSADLQYHSKNAFLGGSPIESTLELF